MADKQVNIVMQLRDMASAGIESVQRKVAEFGTTLTKASEAAQIQKDKLESIGKAGATLGILFGGISLGLGAMGSAAIKAAGDFEQQRVAMTTLLGSAEKADKLLKEMKEFAKSTPFEFKDIVDYGKSLLATGVEQEKVISTLKMLGDVASTVGADKMPNIINAFQRTQMHGKLMSEELMLFRDNGVPVLRYLADLYGTNTDEIVKMASQGKISFNDLSLAIKKAASEGGPAFNAMEDQAKTLSGKTSNLNDAVNLLQTTYSEKLFPVFKPIIDGLTSLINWFDKLPESMKSVIAYTSLAAFGVATLGTVFGGILFALPNIISGFNIVSNTLKGLQIINTINIGLKVFTAELWASEAAMVALQASIGIGIVAALGSMAWWVSHNTDTVKLWGAIATRTFESWAEKAVKALDFLVDAYNNLAKKIPGIPVIDLGLDKTVDKFKKDIAGLDKEIDALEKKLSKGGKPQEAKSNKGGEGGGRSPVEGAVTPSFGGSGKAQVDYAKEQSSELLKIHQDLVDAKKEADEYYYGWEIKELEKLKASKQLIKKDEEKVDRDMSRLRVQETKQESKKLLDIHENLVDEKKASGNYSLKWEIKQLETLKNHHKLVKTDEAKVEKQIAELKIKYNKEVSDFQLADQLATMSAEVENGALRAENARILLEQMLLDETLAAEQKKAIMNDIDALDKKILEDKKARDNEWSSQEMKDMEKKKELKQKGMSDEEQMAANLLDVARKTGEGKTNLAFDEANAIINIKKKEVIAWVDAEAVKYAQEGAGKLAASYGLDPMGWALIALAATASAGVRSALSGIKLAEGGIVMPREGGVPATIAEAGSPEAVIPLNSPTAKQLFNGGGDRIERIILEAEGVKMFAKAIYRNQQYLDRTGQLSKGLI